MSAIGTKPGLDIFLSKKHFLTAGRTGFSGQNIQKPGLSLENTQILQIIQCCMNCQLVPVTLLYVLSATPGFT